MVVPGRINIDKKLARGIGKKKIRIVDVCQTLIAFV